jgi:DNA-binding transcriptional regulator PaaX
MTQSSETGEWAFLTYSLPRDPSAPRLALWRQLKRLGVVQLADGLVALPADARTREQLEWAADHTVAAGGRAGVWLARPTTRAQERELAQTMNAARSEEYQVIIDDAAAVLDADEVERVRALRRLRAENNRVRRRDYFRPPAREQARQALTTLAATLQDDPGAARAEPEVIR